MSFTFAEKRECAERETRFRRRVYERMVNVNKMSRENAERQISIMEEIAADYAEMGKKDQLDLGGGHATRPQRERKYPRTPPPRQTPTQPQADRGDSVERGAQVAQEQEPPPTPPVAPLGEEQGKLNDGTS